MTTNTNTLADDFRKIGDCAYCDYIQQMQRSECLGWEAKVAVKKFGGAELKAHTKAGELLGRHRAFHEAAAALASAAQQPAPREPLSEETLIRMHHEDQFGLFCDYDEFEQIARAIEAAHGITARKEQT